MARVVCRNLSIIISTPALCGSSAVPVRESHWFSSMLSVKTSAPLRAEPKKKKRVDPRRELLVKERLKKKLKKLERVPPELIPIEDFIPSAKFFDRARVREDVEMPVEETERRARLLKDWSRYKLAQHQAEVSAIEAALEAQTRALQELKMESEELYQAAIRPDSNLFPFQNEGPCYTPPDPNHQAPDGKYNDITRVYTQ